MKNAGKLKTENLQLHYLLNFVRYSSFILLFLLSTQVFAQEEVKPRYFGIHAGFNTGILGGGYGPSFSFHYAIRTDKVIQFESMLFFDSHSGSAFMSGYPQKNLGFGLAAGTRINIMPNRIWNPSIIIMPGVIYSSETIIRPEGYSNSGVSGTLCLGISNDFYGKHMLSMGATVGDNIFAVYLKYGIWF